MHLVDSSSSQGWAKSSVRFQSVSYLTVLDDKDKRSECTQNKRASERLRDGQRGGAGAGEALVERDGLNLQRRADGEQAHEAVHGKPHAPHVDRLQFAALAHYHEQPRLRHVPAAPQNNRLFYRQPLTVSAPEEMKERGKKRTGQRMAVKIRLHLAHNSDYAHFHERSETLFFFFFLFDEV